jgi:hypothetical protein
MPNATGAKADPISVLSQHGNAVDVLVMFDGLKSGSHANIGFCSDDGRWGSARFVTYRQDHTTHGTRVNEPP